MYLELWAGGVGVEVRQEETADLRKMGFGQKKKNV